MLVLPIAFAWQRTGRYCLTKVIEDQACPYFLLDEGQFFRMEVYKTYGVCQLAEGRFDSPTHMIKRFDIIQRKILPRKIGYNALKGVRCDRETDNPKFHLVEKTGFQIKIIEMDILGDKTILVRILFDQFRLFSGQRYSQRFVKPIPYFNFCNKKRAWNTFSVPNSFL